MPTVGKMIDIPKKCVEVRLEGQASTSVSLQMFSFRMWKKWTILFLIFSTLTKWTKGLDSPISGQIENNKKKETGVDSNQGSVSFTTTVVMNPQDHVVYKSSTDEEDSTSDSPSDVQTESSMRTETRYPTKNGRNQQF